MDREREELNALIAEADKVIEDCGRYLEAAEELVVGISERRAVLEEHIAAARKVFDEAHAEMVRVINDEDSSRAAEREAERVRDDASWDYYHLQHRLGGDDLDPENRKAVARHLIAMVREDSEQTLDAIAARGDDSELQKTVAEHKEEVFRSTHYLTRRFAEARSLLHGEVRTTRAEARSILDRLKNPPVSS